MNPFSDEALRRFQTALIRVFTRDLSMCLDESVELAKEFSRVLHEDREEALATIARRLSETGIRPRWNQVLSVGRPAALSSWILPHCQGPILDLLCGDGRVGECLSAHGASVTLAERTDSYAITRNHAVPFVAFDDLQQDAGDFSHAFSTVLLCTVLHHETTPDDVLHLASRLSSARVIIVENCVDRWFPADCQFLLDLFFSRCLNSFSLPAAGKHASASRWMTRFSSFGRVRLHERRESLPGIPLSHDLIVLDLKRAPS